MVIVRSTQFKKDFKKISNDKLLVELFQNTVILLIKGVSLPKEYKVHPLTGDKKGFTDIHLKPDLLILFKIDQEKNELHLVRIGSHSAIFG
jgi:mRNA interferase YafQ